MKLTELFPERALELEVLEGYVKSQQHPTLPLTIYNYTDKATYERRWNRVTENCRGLIVNNNTAEVVARGPRKFFNYGEPSATPWPLDTKVRLTRKHDGSLGIIWGYEDVEADRSHWGYATRGSFTSEQAVHATENMHEVIPDSIPQWKARNTTQVDEIVYPGNRIVLDYGDLDKNLPLGEVDNRSGLIIWRPNQVLVDGLPAIMTLAEAIALPIPDDEEGYVLDVLDEYLNVVDHLKLKGDRYKELHAAIFGLSEKVMWEQSCAGTVHAFIKSLPDEVQPWAKAVNDRLVGECSALLKKIRVAERAVREVCGVTTRADQAKYILKFYPDVAPAVFAELDKNWAKQTDWINKQIKPGHVPFSATKESISVG